jgi:hypothetical protein
MAGQTVSQEHPPLSTNSSHTVLENRQQFSPIYHDKKIHYMHTNMSARYHQLDSVGRSAIFRPTLEMLTVFRRRKVASLMAWKG